MSICLSPARAAASRRNGAKSRGPVTPEGKARAAQNALKHGLRAQKHVVLPGEDVAAFRELEAALLEELAPQGALQAVAQRIVAAAWRLARADRLEVELFAENHLAGRSLGLALIRDCNGGARSFDTLLRYRGGTLAELWRALRTLKALQAEAAAAAATATPVEPEVRGNPGETASVAAGGEVPGTAAPALPGKPLAHGRKPIKPETCGNHGETARRPGARPCGPASCSAAALSPERQRLASAPLPCDRQGSEKAEGQYGDRTGATHADGS